ncbi:hypothetical protein QZH41_016827 [Actinostola sp. cb2023]|nr:hypothetical protein QZH41_016827 [Actinostola sp. cb2023]
MNRKIARKSMQENSKSPKNLPMKDYRRGSVVVNYKLTLNAADSDPSLALKQALNSSNGTLNGLTIDPSSIQAVGGVPRIIRGDCGTGNGNVAGMNSPVNSPVKRAFHMESLFPISE